jgi:hypothetical protein
MQPPPLRREVALQIHPDVAAHVDQLGTRPQQRMHPADIGHAAGVSLVGRSEPEIGNPVVAVYGGMDVHRSGRRGWGNRRRARSRRAEEIADQRTSRSTANPTEAPKSPTNTVTGNAHQVNESLIHRVSHIFVSMR